MNSKILEVKTRPKHKFDTIKDYPTIYDDVHESVYRSYSILELVKEMLERWDSKETIIDMIKYLENS